MIRPLHVVGFLLLFSATYLGSASATWFSSNSENMTTEQSNESSDKMYKKACKLSVIWKKGEDNTQLAHQLFEKLAESGNSKAAWQLGFDYENSRGVKADPQKAFEWYKKAADWGNVDGLYNLGNCYYYGTGVQKDYKKALSLFLESAYKGNKSAFLTLPDFYWYGKGTTKDEIEALAWIYIREANSNSEKSQKGINALNGIERDLGTQATLAAQQRAKDISSKITFSNSSR
jgi:TPR repeat protein